LQQAISAATSGTIEVAQGTYKPTTDTDRNWSFNLENNVAIYGGYAGYGMSNPDARNVAAYPTILSGDIGVVGDSSDNSYGVVYGESLNQTAILDGVTITAGNGNYNVTNFNNSGGGMHLQNSSPTLNNVTFSGNNAIIGGGLYEASSSPVLTNCTFSQNTASGTVLLPIGYAGGDGGGMVNVYSSPTLTDCTFIGNTAYYYPGYFSGFGGGMGNNDSFPTLTNCTFIGNTAGYGGGGIYSHISSSPNLINCTFSGNTASSSGGGMYNDSSSPTLTNCIAWGGDTLVDVNNSNTTATYTDIQGGHAGAGNYNADPQFIRNPNPGTDGVWGTGDDDYGNLRLQDASPCINAGSNQAVPAGITTDLDGNPRITYGVVDMGSYEWQMPGDANGDGSVNTLDFIALAQNFNKSSATFSQGDFNYDAKVNALDFNILATKFGTQLVAAAAPVDSPPAAAINVSPTRTASLFGDSAIATDDRRIEDLLGLASD
jgi:parallel beta-helix repeat protein